MSPSLIAVDWGSSSFRAYLLAGGGEVIAEVAFPDGVSTVAKGGFPATLERLIGGWLSEGSGLPVVASGMVGSRQGWVEAPYVKCPAEAGDISANIVTADAGGRVIHLAPGLSFEDETGLPDVMRGEEVEILGVAHEGARLIVLPGSHSKWTVFDRGRITRFKTFVTGELFSAVKDHTIAGAFARAAKSKPLGPAFKLAVSRGAAAVRGGQGQPGLLGALFGTRSLPLMGKLAEDDAGEYLSGLIIGAEIAEGRRLFAGEEPHIAGAEALVARYVAAFEALGERARAAPARAAARGLFLVARARGLVP